MPTGLIYHDTPPPEATMIKILAVKAQFACGHWYIEFSTPLKECELDAMGLMVARHRRECHGCWVVGALGNRGLGVRGLGLEGGVGLSMDG
jgi:hypothetical protein